MEIDELLREKREDILRIAAKHGAYNVRVFGSVAWGEAKADSDVDFLIAAKHGAYNVRVFGSVAWGEAKADSDVDFLIDVGANHSSWFPVRLILDLEELLERKVDIATENNLHWYIKGRVLKEAVWLWRMTNFCRSVPHIHIRKSTGFKKAYKC